LQAFTRNYHDNSTDAGFQFTFYCDICNDGYKSSFIESETYKKRQGARILGQGVGLAGNLLGGKIRNLAYTAERGGNILSERFDGKSPEWQKEHEKSFERAQNEAKQHFHRCPNCNKYVCDHCYNEDAGLCTGCAPRQEVYVAQAHAQAMKRNIEEAGQSATVWQGKIESKTTICPSCGKPAGTGKFCNNCGASMDLKECPKCGAKNAQGVRFCNNCGTNLEQAALQNGLCSSCGQQNPPGTKFCGNCGNKL
ncbi:MAG: zinc ribbon domain-containing protein, partial [Clostridiales bacterium]|nr:zinc ribbon domain-containing protein [Clostridiales bacterium]